MEVLLRLIHLKKDLLPLPTAHCYLAQRPPRRAQFRLAHIALFVIEPSREGRSPCINFVEFSSRQASSPPHVPALPEKLESRAP